MKQLITFTLLICAFHKGSAQINLVYNGSFEDTTQCPIGWDHIKATRYWTGIDSNITIYDTFRSHGMPDLVHTCASSTGSIARMPLNAFFNRYPRTGNAAAAVTVFHGDSDTSWSFYQRDYLQGRLRTALTAGKQYCVTIHATITQSSAYAIDHIGAYFDDGSIDTIPPIRCPSIHSMFHPQVFDTVISNDTLYWTKIQGTFMATGIERFMTIGNFFENDLVDTVQVHYPSIYATSVGLRIWSWYLIDDVSVIAADAVADAGPDGLTSPTGDSVWIGNHDGYVPCRWYNSSGTLIDSNIAGFKVKPAATASYIMELDVCGHVTRDTVTVRVAPASISPDSYRDELGIRNCSVYPNPATDELTVEVDPAFAGAMAGEGLEVVVRDMLGREVMKSQCPAVSGVNSEWRSVIDVSRLSTGCYTVHVIDKVTGQRVVKQFVKR